MVTARQKTSITGRQLTCGIDLEDHHLMRTEYEDVVMDTTDFNLHDGTLQFLLDGDKFNLLASYLVNDKHMYPGSMCRWGHKHGRRVIIIQGVKYVEKGFKIYSEKI